MDNVTVKVAEYVQEKGISISTIAEKINISYGALYLSLRKNPTRKLRGDELLAICSFLGVDPRSFSSVPRGLDDKAS